MSTGYDLLIHSIGSKYLHTLTAPPSEFVVVVLFSIFDQNVKSGVLCDYPCEMPSDHFIISVLSLQCAYQTSINWHLP